MQEDPGSGGADMPLVRGHTEGEGRAGQAQHPAGGGDERRWSLLLPRQPADEGGGRGHRPGRYSILVVVVMNDDGRFFSPANLQTKEAGGVIDLVGTVFWWW